MKNDEQHVWILYEMPRCHILGVRCGPLKRVCARRADDGETVGGREAQPGDYILDDPKRGMSVFGAQLFELLFVPVGDATSR